MEKETHVEWLIPKRVLYFNMEGVVDHAIFSKVNAEVAAHILAGEAPVHMVADIRGEKFHTMNVGWISRTTVIRHPKVGYTIVLGPNRFLKITTEAVRILTKAKIRTVQTMDEAYQVLWAEDATLPRNLK